MTLEVTIEGYESLTDDEKSNASNNGSGKEWATYLRVKHNGSTILLENDAVEPEDATLGRDFAWVKAIIEKAYQLGKQD